MLKKGIEIFLNVLFWLLTSWLVIQFFSIETQEIEIIDGIEKIMLGRNPFIEKALLIGQFFNAALFYFNLWILINHFGNGKPMSRFWLKSVTLFLVIFGVEMIFLSQFIMPQQMLLPWSLSLVISEFFYALSLAYGFTKISSKNEKDKQKLLVEKKQAELNLLRSQLHPHFLFNTLNNLLSLSYQSENPELSDTISRLSDLLRFVIYDTQNKQIELEKEIAFLQDFIELNLIRFEKDELDIKFEVKGEVEKFQIEPGILIPFVENAFKYGVRPEVNSFIHIEIKCEKPDKIFFKISNSKHASESDLPINEGGVGLKNSIERLELVYPGRHELKITDDDHYFVELTINTDENNHS
jgi:two-component system, LytTR family, sensor kinase